jgi:ketosteroid isomerase-like protein
MGTRETVEAFVGAINSGDAEAIGACMTEDHVFIDSLGNRVTGRAAMIAGWRAYLSLFPDYQITVQRLMADGPEALLCGQTRATFHRNGAPADGTAVTLFAAWRALVNEDKIALWQVYADNKPVYDLLAE